MAEPSNNAKNGEDTEQKRFVRGKFPRLPLTEALELPVAVYEVGQGDQVRRLIAFNQLGRSPESGPSRALVTASSTVYGLTDGGTQASHLKLTDRGRRLVEPVSPADRMQAAHEALFDNDIFAGFIDHYQGKVFPREEVAVDWLVTNYDLPEQSARSALGVMKANIEDFGLTEVVSGKTLVASRETAMQNLEGAPAAENTPSAGETKTPPVAPETSDGQRVPTAREAAYLVANGPVIPQIHFNIQIQVPENGSPEDYDAIFRSIGTYLLGRKDN